MPETIHDQRRSPFFVTTAGVLLAIVLVGFAPTLFLRVFFRPDPADAIPLYLHVHGAILTAWYVCFVLQATLIKKKHWHLHRRLGPGIVAIGIAVVLISFYTTFEFGSRLESRGIDPYSNPRFPEIVWSNFANLAGFSVFLGAAVIFRARAELHKRLMLLASISIISPALARVSRWPLWGSVDEPTFNFWGVLILLVLLVAYDYVSDKRFHFVTIVGAIYLLLVAKIILGTYVANADIGREFFYKLL